MIDVHFRFLDEAVFLDAMRPLGMTQIEDEVERATPGSLEYAIDVIGEIAGIMGWHVNLRLINEQLDVSALDPWRVFPSAPSRVWA